MDQVLTKNEAAEFLKLSPKTIDYLVVSGQIPFSRLGKRSVRFSTSRLLQWIEEREGKLNCSVSTVYALCDSGELRHYRFRKAYRIKCKDLDSYMRKAAVETFLNAKDSDI